MGPVSGPAVAARRASHLDGGLSSRVAQKRSCAKSLVSPFPIALARFGSPTDSGAANFNDWRSPAFSPRSHQRASLMKVLEIAFVGYPVTDLKRARQFYEGTLGLKMTRSAQTWSPASPQK